jgi:hypothetical protein
MWPAPAATSPPASAADHDHTENLLASSLCRFLINTHLLYRCWFSARSTPTISPTGRLPGSVSGRPRTAPPSRRAVALHQGLISEAGNNGPRFGGSELVTRARWPMFCRTGLSEAQPGEASNRPASSGSRYPVFSSFSNEPLRGCSLSVAPVQRPRTHTHGGSLVRLGTGRPSRS